MLALRAPYRPVLVGRPASPKPPANGNDGECATCARQASGGKYDLHSADASRDGALKELLLLEKHLSQEACSECSFKHASCAVAYLEEARTLLGGDAVDSDMAAHLDEVRMGDLAGGLDSVRRVRKAIAARLGRGHAVGDHAHDAALVAGADPNQDPNPVFALLLGGVAAAAVLFFALRPACGC